VCPACLHLMGLFAYEQCRPKGPGALVSPYRSKALAMLRTEPCYEVHFDARRGVLSFALLDKRAALLAPEVAAQRQWTAYVARFTQLPVVPSAHNFAAAIPAPTPSASAAPPAPLDAAIGPPQGTPFTDGTSAPLPLPPACFALLANTAASGGTAMQLHLPAVSATAVAMEQYTPPPAPPRATAGIPPSSGALTGSRAPSPSPPPSPPPGPAGISGNDGAGAAATPSFAPPPLLEAFLPPTLSRHPPPALVIAAPHALLMSARKLPPPGQQADPTSATTAEANALRALVRRKAPLSLFAACARQPTTRAELGSPMGVFLFRSNLNFQQPCSPRSSLAWQC